MNEKYELLSDTALDSKLEELQNAISAIQDEKARRQKADKKKAWHIVIDAIQDYCDKYGAITVEGESDLNMVSLDITSDADVSCVGLIEM